MIRKSGRTTLDFEALENAFSKQPAVFLFCSPYNPCGTLFTEAELRELADLCETYDVLLCSDEIHSDFVLDPENRHIPTATVSETAARRTITLMAPSKTYNIPGLGCAFAVIPNPDLRARFTAGCKGIVPTVNLMGDQCTARMPARCHCGHISGLDRCPGNRIDRSGPFL